METTEFIDHEMIEVSIDFWFRDNETVRSPFPDYMKPQLREIAVIKFANWANKLSDEAKKEIIDEIKVERFEEILFEEALNLAMTEEEKITIQYPFLLRLGDRVKEGVHPESEVIARTIIKNKEQAFLNVEFKEIESGLIWNTSFELP